LRILLVASDQLSNPAVASEPICSEIDAWVTILRRALRFTFERSAQTSLLTAREEIELAARMKKGDQKTGAWRSKANLRLVVRIRDELTKGSIPRKEARKVAIVCTKPDGRQAGKKDKNLVKKSEWQIEQPVRSLSRRLLRTSVGCGYFPNCNRRSSGRDFLYGCQSKDCHCDQRTDRQ
jgi:hypothetical protein